MDLSYSDEQQMLRESAQRYLRSEYDYARRQRIAAGDEGWSREIWAQFADMGWLALPLPESVGGLGGGAIELGVLMEAFGRALVVEPYFATVVLGAGAVVLGGDTRQQAEILPAVATGERLLAFAHAEPHSRGRRDAVQTSARRCLAGWRLDGFKPCVSGAQAADTLIVSARLYDADGDLPGTVALFLVPAADARRTPCLMIDGSQAADVELREVIVPPAALLGERRDAMRVIEAVLDRGIIALAADAVGVIEVLLDATVDYAKTRVQFGQPIGQLQALQHRMAEMALEREEARAVMQYALIVADGDAVARARAASAVKVKIGRAARYVAEQAVQLHGAMGVTEELAIGAYLKRGLRFELMLGSSDHHLQRYAQLARAHGLFAQGLISDGHTPARSAIGAGERAWT